MLSKGHFRKLIECSFNYWQHRLIKGYIVFLVGFNTRADLELRSAGQPTRLKPRLCTRQQNFWHATNDRYREGSSISRGTISTFEGHYLAYLFALILISYLLNFQREFREMRTKFERWLDLGRISGASWPMSYGFTRPRTHRQMISCHLHHHSDTISSILTQAARETLPFCSPVVFYRIALFTVYFVSSAVVALLDPRVSGVPFPH